MRTGTIRRLMHLQIDVESSRRRPLSASPSRCRTHHINPLTGEDEASLSTATTARRRISRLRDIPVNPNDPNTWGKVQRNAPCPCGSGRKFKHCHGALV